MFANPHQQAGCKSVPLCLVRWLSREEEGAAPHEGSRARPALGLPMAAAGSRSADLGNLSYEKATSTRPGARVNRPQPRGNDSTAALRLFTSTSAKDEEAQHRSCSAFPFLHWVTLGHAARYSAERPPAHFHPPTRLQLPQHQRLPVPQSHRLFKAKHFGSKTQLNPPSKCF